MSDTQQLRSFFLALIDSVLSLGAVAVDGELTGDVVRFSFFGDETPQRTPLHTLEVPAGLYQQVIALFSDRSFHWPDPADPFWSLNVNHPKRLLVAPPSRGGFITDVLTNRKAGASHASVSMRAIRPGPTEGLLSWLDAPPQVNDALSRAATQSRGLALASVGSRPGAVDGRAVLSALRPDALYFPMIDADSATRAVELANECFVIAGMPGDDPVEMTAAFLAWFGRSSESLRAARQALELSFVHARVRRVCSACAKPTPVDSRMRSRIPIAVSGSVKDQYLFGRGCDQCGHSAYRGTVGLTSAMRFDQPLVEALETGNPSDLARIAYVAGTRTLLEDGMRLIGAGLTSFEEVFAVTARVSSAFAHAIASMKDAGTGRTSASAATAGGAERGGSQLAGGRGSKQRLLVVEDDVDQREVLEVVFRSDGYEVLVASNGKEALEKLQQHTVDLIVCDVMMPVMNGAQLVRAVRADNKLSHLPVLMLTAVQNKDAEFALLDQGADDYCEKTVQRKVLLKRVAKLLSRSQRNPLQHMLDD